MEVFSVHTLFEVLAYGCGAQWFWRLRRRSGAARLPSASVPIVVAGLLIGALIGAKVLAWLESPLHYWSLRFDPRVWIGGKTIVGGVLGGWIGVEVGKKIAGLKIATGDLFVFPVLLGMAIGRVGCFFAGLEDKTYGLPTSLPWGVDFGDGIPRHPTQLYEIVLLVLLGIVLWRRAPSLPNGRLFREMMIGYLLLRLCVDFLKPRFTYPLVSLSAIQMACLAGIGVAAWQIARLEQELPANG